MIRLSTSAIFFLISILILSIFVANFANIVNIDSDLLNKLNRTSENSELLQRQKLLHISDSPEHLMWFIQISDIHISIFSDKTRIDQFRDFVKNTIDVIKPTVVLASGDLVDGRDSNILGSRQYLGEWEIYKDILTESEITQKTVWLDIRGNHDYFNVPSFDSPFNYFKTYSIQGKLRSRSYLHQITVGNEKYSFIAVDACLEPGPKRQYNFIGLLTKNETSYLIDLNEEARRLGGNYTIWFGHYPTSCIISSGTGDGGIRDIIGQHDESYAYLCGHLHTQGGLAPKMYTMQKAGFLELELGDWKQNRVFRVAAFDHGLFSFTDVHYNEWPIILVTNPKDALFNIPSREYAALQSESTHIRMLVFTPSEVVYCGVKIDKEDWKQCTQISTNLFITPWCPTNYKHDIHNIEVIVKTKDGRSNKVVQPFSLDGTRLNFKLWNRFILMSDLNSIFQQFFASAIVICTLPLCILRVMHELVIAGKCKKPRIKWNWLKKNIRKLWILSSVNRIFFPLLLYFIYIVVGPWSFCEVIDGHMGILFLWGIYVNNAFLPGTLTYVHGFFQLMFCQLPLIFIFADFVNFRFMQYCGIMRTTTKFPAFIIHMPLVVVVIIEIVLAILFWYTYGTLAFLLGPFRAWSIIFNGILLYLAYNIPEKCLRPSMTVWRAS